MAGSEPPQANRTGTSTVEPLPGFSPLQCSAAASLSGGAHPPAPCLYEECCG